MSGQQRVAVAGATGTVGRHVVTALTAAGHEAVSLTRADGIDLVTGNGLDDALAGVDAVVDVTNVSTGRAKTSIAFFEATTGHLLRAAASAQVRHVVVLSIVGSDRVDIGYYHGKRRQEQLALQSGQPVSILRSTQFHEFPGLLLSRSRGPLAVIPRMRVQPVAAAEVGQALATLAVGPAVGMAPELGGPDVHELTELARWWLAARSSRRIVVPLRLPGAVGSAMVGRALLPDGSGPRGSQTFDAWLCSTSPAPTG